MEMVCLLLVLATHNKWEVHQMDVKSVFLNGVLTEEVYVRQPLIRLQRIHNFLCSMLVFTPFA
jgi:hypothetical protein